MPMFSRVEVYPRGCLHGHLAFRAEVSALDREHGVGYSTGRPQVWVLEVSYLRVVVTLVMGVLSAGLAIADESARGSVVVEFPGERSSHNAQSAAEDSPEPSQSVTLRTLDKLRQRRASLDRRRRIAIIPFSNVTSTSGAEIGMESIASQQFAAAGYEVESSRSG